MNKQWVENKNKEKQKEIQSQKAKILDMINNCGFANNDAKTEIIRIINEYEKEPYGTANSVFIALMKHTEDLAHIQLEDVEAFMDSLDLDNYIMNLRYNNFNVYLDSDPVEFDGDVLITDPCYIVKDRDESTRPKWEDFMRLKDYRGMSEKEKRAAGYYEDYERMRKADAEWEEANPDDWDVCEGGYKMGALGLKTFMSRNTLYGDWGCTTFNSDTKEAIGQFCADSGMVGVFSLYEVLKYNPGYTDYITKPWCATVIENFKGTVQFVVEKNKDSRYEDFNVRVIGRGVNKSTGQPLNFITSQTSL